jgi:hypothetical protein
MRCSRVLTNSTNDEREVFNSERHTRALRSCRYVGTSTSSACSMEVGNASSATR